MGLFRRGTRQGRTEQGRAERWDVLDYLADAAASERRLQLSTEAEREARRQRVDAHPGSSLGASRAEILEAYGDDPWIRHDLERKADTWARMTAAIRVDDYLERRYGRDPELPERVREAREVMLRPFDDAGAPVNRDVLARRVEGVLEAVADDKRAEREPPGHERGPGVDL